MTRLIFDYLAAHSNEHQVLARAYDEAIKSIFATPLWISGPARERRILWMQAHLARSIDAQTFTRAGLYIWGAGERPLYIGKTETSFYKRFHRYIWNQRSQCNLARDFESELIEYGIGGFPPEIQEWYAKDFGTSTVRLKGAVRFAKEGISTVWFVLLPASDACKIREVEKVLIPVANAWNLQSGRGPLLNVESNRDRMSRATKRPSFPYAAASGSPAT